ncbi:hypothetical protein [Ammoniphilus resinae]|uniref:Type II secretory pathway component PulJ n=1 Tax=Ammoniphilus resinae TaxID=861532 RepID=A0ABS4GLX7_9BACL|nr:hypothetical protein [Ammoniphilus resinae]MBP1931271.1 type II secretory pathway component PulJ [Ammoniphilus resinae]
MLYYGIAVVVLAILILALVSVGILSGMNEFYKSEQQAELEQDLKIRV